MPHTVHGDRLVATVAPTAHTGPGDRRVARPVHMVLMDRRVARPVLMVLLDLRAAPTGRTARPVRRAARGAADLPAPGAPPAVRMGFMFIRIIIGLRHR
jgi:hypothetical protein